MAQLSHRMFRANKAYITRTRQQHALFFIKLRVLIMQIVVTIVQTKMFQICLTNYIYRLDDESNLLVIGNSNQFFQRWAANDESC